MDIMKLLETLSTGDIAIIIVVLLSLVQIAPIKIDPWTAIGKWIGKLLTGDLAKQIDGMEKSLAKRMDAIEEKVDSLEAKEEKRDAVNKRVRILRFEDELQEERRHSKDSFDQVMGDITDYNTYCSAHPEFKNEQTESTVNHIKKVYAERLEKRDFL